MAGVLLKTRRRTLIRRGGSGAFTRVPFNKTPNPANSSGRVIMLTEALIYRLAASSAVLAKYPFLRPPGPGKPVSKGCKCGRSKEKKAADVNWANSVKNAILGLSSDALKEFKTIAGADTLVVYIKTNQGVIKREV